ncbi:MAG: AarF/ABC1/UbiB kinase family protein [Planctomycetaceae bacterium]|nr:AarF/ABC1/UbiB kinase family protein [Planctomycetaceae bacterium]
MHFLTDFRRVLTLTFLVLRWLGPLFLRRVLCLGPGRLSTAVRLRRAFEAGGVTFHKIGQYLSMRFDILPAELCREFAGLLEAVPPLDPSVAIAEVELALGGPIARFFARFEPDPIGSASIAQVHKALTREGELVAVKIRRPHVREAFLCDMRLLRRPARFADWFGMLGSISLVEFMNEVEASTLREMDFQFEARTAERVRQDGSPYATTPRIFWPLCTPSLLTMQFIEGVSLQQVCRAAESGGEAQVRALLPGVDLRNVVTDLSRACLYQLFVSGVFHGDPHPGNILIQHNGQVTFIDFGIFGTLDINERRLLRNYIESNVRGNLMESARCYARITLATSRTDMRAYLRELLAVLTRWYAASADPATPVAERHSGRYQMEMLMVMRRHHAEMRPNQLLFWRVLLVLDATVLRLPVKVDLLQVMIDFFTRCSPRFPEQLRELLEELSSSATGLRRRVNAMDRMESHLKEQMAGRTSLPTNWQRRAPDTNRLSRAAQGTAIALLGIPFALGALHTSDAVGLLCLGIAALLASGIILIRLSA